MDQAQDQLDPEVAQEMITLLNKKIANLRNENSQLQSQLSRAAVKSEDQAHGVPNDRTQRLLEEIEHLKSEIERRQDPGEVAILEKRLERSKQRRRESEQNLQSLHTELEEKEATRQKDKAIKKMFQKEIKKLCSDLNQSTREKEEALARLESQQSDDFDVHRFLRGELEELPPMPNPVVVTGEGNPRFKGVIMRRRSHKYILSVNGPNTIKWANKSGGCVVPFPPAIYNGRKHLVEQPCQEIIENQQYELFGVDGHYTYYGTYRCIKVAAMDWSVLNSLDQKFARAFLETTVLQDGLAAPVVRALITNMYKTGILKAGCAILRCEGLDDTIVKEMQSADGLSTIRNLLVHNNGKRPNDDHTSGERTRKKRRLSSKVLRRAPRPVRSTRPRTKPGSSR